MVAAGSTKLPKPAASTKKNQSYIRQGQAGHELASPQGLRLHRYTP